jgi:hypothetical protein
VTEAGQRCPGSHGLEFDHIVPVALGGKPTLDNVRLRCRAHNQYEAERTFGAEFMRQKREAAQAARAAADPRDECDLVQPLRLLGFRVEEARRAATHVVSMRGAPLEERLRTALGFLAPKARAIRPISMGASG